MLSIIMHSSRSASCKSLMLLQMFSTSGSKCYKRLKRAECLLISKGMHILFLVTWLKKSSLIWSIICTHRENDKKVCCLGLTALLPVPADQMPGEALERIFKAALDLLVAYKDQVAGCETFISLFIFMSAT